MHGLIPEWKQLGQVAPLIPVVPKRMRYLFGDDQDTNAGKQSLDHARGKIVRDSPEFCNTHQYLQDACDKDCAKEKIISTNIGDRTQHQGGKTSCRAADAEF